MKKLLLLSISAISFYSCTKKCPTPPSLKSEVANTSWKPLFSAPWTLKLTKDSAFYLGTSGFPAYAYYVSNDTLFFYDDDDTVKYKFSLYNHLMTTTNIPFDGSAAQYQQIN